jgi:hypothetical protein
MSLSPENRALAIEHLNTYRADIDFFTFSGVGLQALLNAARSEGVAALVADAGPVQRDGEGDSRPDTKTEPPPPSKAEQGAIERLTAERDALNIDAALKAELLREYVAQQNAERDALAKRAEAGAAMIDQAAVKAAVALQVRLAMQSEMMSPDHLRVQRRTKRAEEAADAILSHLALTPSEPNGDASRQSGREP